MHQTQRIELLTADEAPFLRVSRHRPDDGSWSNAEISKIGNDDRRHKHERGPAASALEHRRKKNDGKKFGDCGASEHDAGTEIGFLLPREKRQSDKPNGNGVDVSATGKLPNDQRVPCI